MSLLSLRNLTARPWRVVLTALAVVLGVAMISGALTVGDTMGRAANSLTLSAYSGTDASVSAPLSFTATADGSAALPTLPETEVARIAALPGVGAATADLTDQRVTILDRRGKAVGHGPYFGVGTNPAKGLTPFRLHTGRWANADDQVVVDQSTADAQHLHAGSVIRIQAHGPARAFRVVGTAYFGSVKSMGGATFAVFTVSAAQDILGQHGRVDSVLVRAAAGVRPADLRRSLQQAVPAARVQSAQTRDRFSLKSLHRFVSIIEAVLLAFGLIATFVGGFTIANAQAMAVAQRSRELATLRTLGASRRQLLAGLLAEGALMGVVASVAGLALGLALAEGLLALLSSMNLSLPVAGTRISTGALMLAGGVGVTVSALGTLGPALRATRISPVIAMREGADLSVLATRRLVSRAAWVFSALAALTLPTALFAPGLMIGSRLPLVGVGGLLLFVSVALLAPRIAVPLAALLGRPAARIAGPAGSLARLNSMRNPRRTASTAAALMIGVALVVFVSSLSAGLTSVAGTAVVKQVRTPYVVAFPDGFTTFSPTVESALARVPGGAITGIRVDQVSAYGQRTGLNGVDPGRLAWAWRLDWRAGSAATLATLGARGAIVNDNFATAHRLRVGSRLTLQTISGRPLALTVRGIVRPPQINVPPLGTITVDRRLLSPGAQDRLVLATGPRRGLEQALASYPTLKLYTASGYADLQTSWIASMSGIFDVLLAIAVIISLLGIANTLSLSVFERTRELGMLRSLGMTRRQTRRMIRHESVIMAVMGATLGTVVGLFLAALVTVALRSLHLPFQLPWGTLTAFAVVAVLAGILAALGPARRAARMAPLAALAHE